MKTLLCTAVILAAPLAIAAAENPLCETLQNAFASQTVPDHITVAQQEYRCTQPGENQWVCQQAFAESCQAKDVTVASNRSESPVKTAFDALDTAVAQCMGNTPVQPLDYRRLDPIAVTLGNKYQTTPEARATYVLARIKLVEKQKQVCQAASVSVEIQPESIFQPFGYPQ
jgi:hypothetical protein